MKQSLPPKTKTENTSSADRQTHSRAGTDTLKNPLCKRSNRCSGSAAPPIREDAVCAASCGGCAQEPRPSQRSQFCSTRWAGVSFLPASLLIHFSNTLRCSVNHQIYFNKYFTKISQSQHWLLTDKSPGGYWGQSGTVSGDIGRSKLWKGGVPCFTPQAAANKSCTRWV